MPLVGLCFLLQVWKHFFESTEGGIPMKKMLLIILVGSILETAWAFGVNIVAGALLPLRHRGQVFGVRIC